MLRAPLRIAFLVDGLMSRYQIRLLNGARAAARRHGVQLVGFQGSFLRRTGQENTVFDGSFVFDLAGPRAVDGLIPISTVLATTVGLEAVQRLCESSGLPTVSVGELPGVPSVALEPSTKLSELARHLVLDHGRRRIGFIRGNQANPESGERELAVTNALRELGVPVDERRMVQGNFLEASGRSAMRTLLDERGLGRDGLDAIIAANDQMATGAALELLRRGVRVPEDIAVVGFDDDDHARSATPPLTTVAQPIELLGARAVELLLDRIQGKAIAPVTRLPAEAVYRRSCGCDWPRRPFGRPAAASSPNVLGVALRDACERQSTRSSPSGGDRRVVDALVNAVCEPDEARVNTVFAELERELFSSTAAGGDPLRWEDAVISTSGGLAELADSDESARHALLRLQRVRLLVNETASREHRLGRLHAVQQATATRVLGSALALAKDLKALARVLEGTIGGLGVRYCDVCLFLPGGEARAVKLIAHHLFQGASSVDLPYDTGELWRSLPHTRPPGQAPKKSVIFPAANLLNDADGWPLDQDLLVYPLVFAEEALGYIVFDAPLSLEHAWLHENVAGHVSSAVSALGKKQELGRSREAAERASAAKSEFVAVMSHELRTPLNAILGHLDLCLRTPLSNEQRKHTARAQAAARSLLEIVNDVLDFLEIEAEKLDLEQTTFELEAVLSQLRDTCALSASRKGLELVFDVGSEVPLHLIGDPLRLTQVLVNLLGNAIKFSEQGHVLLRVECVEHEAATGTRLSFEVEDTGIGMKPEQLETLFSAFTQGDSSMSRRYGGTGLGLSICKRLVSLMGGSLTVVSEFGRGSCFGFVLPFTEVKQRAPVPALGLGARALVLEDSPAQARALGRILEACAYAVNSAGSFAEAETMLRQAELHGLPYALVFADTSLPDAQGEAELSRRLAEVRSPTVILCSEGQDARTGVLSKPYDIGSVLSVLEGVGSSERPLGSPSPSFALVSLQGRRLLLVHDSEFARELAYELLSGAGAHVALATEGAEGVQLAADADFDAILMDLYMPNLDGSEAALRIRKLPRHAHTPILAITASTSEADLERCRAAGMQPCPPPASPEAFLSAVASTVSQRSSVPPRSSQRGELRSAPRQPTPKVAHDPSTPHENGLELDAALARLDGDLNMYRRMLKRFLTSHEHLLGDMQAARSAGDDKRALLLIHTLAGSAASIGARHLTRLSRALEAALKAGENQVVEALLVDLQPTLSSTFASVQQALSNARARAPSGTLPAVAVRPLLSRLQKLLEAHDTAAIESFDLLRSLCVGKPRLSERLVSLESCISSYDFESAKSELNLFAREFDSLEGEIAHGV
ncbi:MAG: substrate-binding domain-containing protein [Polyangiaceae bacterium]